jgi:acetyltransferase-like isoleucine patch superfamily enzyme
MAQQLMVKIKKNLFLKIWEIHDFFYRFLLIYKEQKHKYRLKVLHEQIQSIGMRVVLRKKFIISHPEFVLIGNNVHIGENAYFSTLGGLTIGDNTHISRNVTIYTNSHEYENDCLPFNDRNKLNPVLIGKNVWIGMNVNIAPGTIIGDGAIIGIGCTVYGKIEPLEIVGAPKVKLIKNRDQDKYYNLDESSSYCGDNGVRLNVNEVKQYYANFSEVKVIFVLSTGRSGSQAISKVFAQHDNIDSFHEPHYQIIRISTELEHGVITREQAKFELQSIYCNSLVYSRNIVYLESEHRLFNLVQILKELIPESKFIWLIRDGRDVVSSTFGRGWYNPDKEAGAKPLINKIPGIWDYYRLDADKAGIIDHDDWVKMDIFSKNCWYWSYVNESIERQLSSLRKEDKFFVKIENLSNSITELCDFIGVANEKMEVFISNSANYKVKKYEEWTDKEKNIFSDLCGDNLEKWYGYKLEK